MAHARERVDELSEKFNKETGNRDRKHKKNQSEMKNTWTEINTLQRISSRVDEAMDQIRDLEDKKAESSQSEQQKEKRIQKYKDSIRSLWDNFKHTNICIMGVPEGEESKKLKTYVKNNNK